MIPPAVPGQIEEQQNMVGWKNTFNMRQVTIINLAASQIGTRNGIKHDPKSYINHGCITNPIKSLDILRKNIQNAVNKDIDCIIKKYLDKFFQPAVNNIRQNQGRDSVNEEHVKLMCRKMLEDAKTMYKASNVSRDSSPHEYSDSDPGGYFESRFSLVDRKRKESDTDSESTTISSQKRHKAKDWEEIAKLPIKREAPKWSSERLNQRTLFIMGARANKVLGFSQTRGRLYVRHPELIRYAGDQEDREWLTSKYLMPASGGKAYIMIFDDVRELAMCDEYKNNPNLRLHELKGFEAPPFLLNKIKLYIERMRTDKKIPSVDLFDFHQVQSITSPLDSAPSTPSDTLHESQSASTTSSKHSENNFVNIPEISPSSNNSLMSGQLTQSPIPSSSSLLSPNLLMTIATSEGQSNNGLIVLRDNHQNDSCLSTLLASHMSSDNSQDF
ncbi:deoxynucleotidyltransferase terminal-interacting protein 1 [Onthophagus taurus]|uniref:deoxynucleotidyltransferase terminal-interacting protein 1 n=1 Tax=Onthophagus taurus TaxID=166361 RepID=UPI000C200116|nr:deoxynucleotidyltransferase terminal-interacting protein 1 [Onthophagus taurus]